MGMRLADPRWFRTIEDRIQRLRLRTMEWDVLTKMEEHLSFAASLGPLPANSWVEHTQVLEEISRQVEESTRSERCPVCGGWRCYPIWYLEQGKDSKPYKPVGCIPCCRDCGWPHADDIYGSNLVVSGPRTGFKLSRIL